MSDAPVAPTFRSGFVSLIGRPNVGKSTLLNALVGHKVAIVADKPQTTRTAIQGVLTTPEAQVIFIDTPGIHESKTLLNRRMMETVRDALDERDLLLLLADATRARGDEDRHALDLVRKSGTPTLLVLNKIDLLKDKKLLLPLIEQYKSEFDFADYFPISAAKGDGLDELRGAIISRLPEGPAYFDPDHITDQPERFLAAELIREKVLQLTREEVPHSVAVVIDQWEEAANITRIYATILVDRPGQKGIIIGARGVMLKRIGTEARHEMERLFGTKIFVGLHVKLQLHWRENPAFLDAIDWRTMAGR
jgi:GTP-binding protein Era